MGMEKELYLTIDCSKGGPSLTKQQFTNDVDINNIVAKFDKTAMLEHVSKANGFYGDVSEIADYKDALNTVIQAEELFYGMSAKIRDRFANDPAKMIEFLQDKGNLDEAISLGMVNPKAKEPVQPPAAAGGDAGKDGK